MKKLFPLMVLAMMSVCLMSCSSDDDGGNGIVVPQQLFGTWTLVNDAEPLVVTTLVFSNEKFINYSATNTAINPTIPANCPTYTKEIVTTTQAYPTNQKEWVREQGYFTISGNSITFWPQVSRNSTDMDGNGRRRPALHGVVHLLVDQQQRHGINQGRWYSSDLYQIKDHSGQDFPNLSRTTRL